MWKLLMRRRWLWMAAGGVVAAGVVALAVVFRVGGINALGSAASVAALIPFAVSALLWVRRQTNPMGTARREHVDRALPDLAQQVEQHWRAEARAWRLYESDPIRVRWRMAERPDGSHCGPAADQQDRMIVGDTAADVAKWFLGLDRKRLVIIGGPGMGKTTLAVQLLLALMARASAGEKIPVPVLFSLSSFDPQAHTLDEWLSRQIVEVYPRWASFFGRETSSALIQARMVLPVLDGLDEVPEEKRPFAIAWMNSALADGKLEVILTCRTEEYGGVVQQSDELRGAAVIQPEPISGVAAANYLSGLVAPSRQDAWEPVLTILRGGSAVPVTQALSTPLMLWLTGQAYRDPGRNPSELADPSQFPTPTRIEAHLLGEMVPVLFRVYSADPAQPTRLRRRWRPELAQRWLSYIAFRMSRNWTRDLAWWDLWQWCRPHIHRFQTSNAAARWFGVAATLGAGGVGWAAGWLVGGPGNAYLCGLAFGFASWVTNRVVTVIPYYYELPRVWSGGMAEGAPFGVRGMFGRLTRVGMVGLAGWLTAWLIVSLTNGLAAKLAMQLVLGTFVALTTAFAIYLVVNRVGYVSLLKMPWHEGRVGTLRTNRRQFNAGWLAAIIIGAVGLGLAAGIARGLAAGLTAGLLGALGAGLAGGLWLGLYNPWAIYSRAHIVLALRGHVPWRLMRFLADCHLAGVVRQLGDAYQFRHALVQDRLSSAYDAAMPPAERERRRRQSYWEKP